MLHDSLVILDFETTGLRPEDGDRITEVGLVRIDSGRITDRFQSLVNCDVRVPSFITDYTGITQWMVDQAPPVETVIRAVARFVGDTPLVAHNASFDQRFLTRECRRQRIGIVIEPFICSMRLARRVYPELKSHSLGVLAHALQLQACGTAHRAAADAEMTAQLMLRIGQDIAGMQQGVPVTAQLMRRLMRIPVARAQSSIESLCA